MALVLAVEPDARQAAILRRLVGEYLEADFVLTDSREAAVKATERRIPDLILVSALLSPRDEAELNDHLKRLEGGEHLQTLTIPLLGSFDGESEKDEPPRGLFKVFKRKSRTTRQAGCDPIAYADELKGYLKLTIETRAERAARAEWTARVEQDRIAQGQAEQDQTEGDQVDQGPIEQNQLQEEPIAVESLATPTLTEPIHADSDKDRSETVQPPPQSIEVMLASELAMLASDDRTAATSAGLQAAAAVVAEAGPAREDVLPEPDDREQVTSTDRLDETSMVVEAESANEVADPTQADRVEQTAFDRQDEAPVVVEAAPTSVEPETLERLEPPAFDLDSFGWTRVAPDVSTGLPELSSAADDHVQAPAFTGFDIASFELHEQTDDTPAAFDPPLTASDGAADPVDDRVLVPPSDAPQPLEPSLSEMSPGVVPPAAATAPLEEVHHSPVSVELEPVNQTASAPEPEPPEVVPESVASIGLGSIAEPPEAEIAPLDTSSSVAGLVPSGVSLPSLDDALAESESVETRPAIEQVQIESDEHKIDLSRLDEHGLQTEPEAPVNAPDDELERISLFDAGTSVETDEEVTPETTVDAWVASRVEPEPQSPATDHILKTGPSLTAAGPAREDIASLLDKPTPAIEVRTDDLDDWLSDGSVEAVVEELIRPLSDAVDPSRSIVIQAIEEPELGWADSSRIDAPRPPATEPVKPQSPEPPLSEPRAAQPVEAWIALPDWTEPWPALGSSVSIRAKPLPQPKVKPEPVKEPPPPQPAAEPSGVTIDGRWLASALDALRTDIQMLRHVPAAALADGNGHDAPVASAPLHGKGTQAAGPEKAKGARTRRQRPIRDEWGLYDPTQCGFEALFAAIDAHDESDNGVEHEPAGHHPKKTTKASPGHQPGRRPSPLAMWARAERGSRKPADTEAASPRTVAEDLRELLGNLELPEAIASVAYPGGCRIRRVRVSRTKRPRRSGSKDPVIILSRKILRSEQPDEDAALTTESH